MRSKVPLRCVGTARDAHRHLDEADSEIHDERIPDDKDNDDGMRTIVGVLWENGIAAAA